LQETRNEGALFFATHLVAHYSKGEGVVRALKFSFGGEGHALPVTTTLPRKPLPFGSSARHLLSCGTGKILFGSWSTGRKSHHSPPKLSPTEQVAFIEKVKALAPKYRTELLREA